MTYKYSLSYYDIYPEIPPDLEEEYQAEWVKCRKDIFYFISKYYWIEDKETNQMIRFRLWPEQKKLLHHLMDKKTPYHIILKARQLGISIEAGAVGIHEFNFFAHSHVLIESKKEDDAKDLLAKMMLSFERLPLWMRAPLVESNKSLKVAGYEEKDNKGNKVLKGLKSRMEAIASGGGASKTVTLNIRDEAALVEDTVAAKTHKQSFATLSNTGGRCFVISTAEGAWGWFYNMYWAAKRGESSFLAHFLPWWANPKRTQEWYDKMKKSYHNADEFINQFPANDLEAFLSSGRTYFSKFILNELEKDGKSPYAKKHNTFSTGPRLREPVQGYIEGGYSPDDEVYVKAWVDDPEGIIDKFVDPNPGHRYCLSIDLAEGKITSPDMPKSKQPDNTSVNVFDLNNNEQVARIKVNHIPPDEMAIVCAKLAIYYNGALIIPEINKEGLAFLRPLRAIYKNIYFREESDDKIAGKIRKEYGWLTKSNNRSLMLSSLAILLKESVSAKEHRLYKDTPRLIIHSSDTINEFRKFIVNDRGKAEAASGEKDDDVMSCALAAIVIMSDYWGLHTFVPEAEEPEELTFSQQYHKNMAKKEAERLDNLMKKPDNLRRRRKLIRITRRA